MALPLTEATLSAVTQVAKEPNIVLEIEGVSTIYGSLVIEEYAVIGDDLEIGDPETNPLAFYIGGLTQLVDQDNTITLSDTSNSIRQALNVDKAQVSSVTNMTIGMVDDGDITNLITPGNVIPDILGAKCKVYLGFRGTAWPDDYVVIFRGVVTEVSADPGKVLFQINSPEDKKRSNIFKKFSTKLNGSITNSQTTITVDNASGFLQPITGPSGVIDTNFKTCVRIGNELIRFTGITGNDLTGCTRGFLTTTAASHNDDAEVDSIYVMSGNCVDVALKMMCSGVNGAYRSGVSVTQFGLVDSVPTANAIYFEKINVVSKYNIQVGDYVTTTGAINGANNVTLREILDIIDTENGSYLLIDGASLVSEEPVSSTISFRSQYDVWPDGLRLDNDEVDFDEHNRLKQLFLSNFDYTFYLKDTVENASEFLEQEVYSPVAAYSLPRKTRASLGYHIGPIPGQDIKIINEDSVKSASKSKLSRTTNRNFYNEIVYRFDESLLEDKFLTGVITLANDSKTQIKTANKTLTISSKGLRSTEQGEAIAISQSNRRLERYKFAAELVKLQVTFDLGFNLEVGDIVVYDGSNLSLPDIKFGAKGMVARLFEISNKEINLKTGDIGLELIDTGFDGSARYGLISPSSLIASAVSTTVFNIKESFSGRFGSAEYRKWEKLVGSSVRVRNNDFSQVSDSVITSVSFNQITVSPALSFTPVADMVLELTNYNDVDVTDNVKLIYAHMRDSAFADGKPQYQML